MRQNYYYTSDISHKDWHRNIFVHFRQSSQQKWFEISVMLYDAIKLHNNYAQEQTNKMNSSGKISLNKRRGSVLNDRSCYLHCSEWINLHVIWANEKVRDSITISDVEKFFSPEKNGNLCEQRAHTRTR